MNNLVLNIYNFRSVYIDPPPIAKLSLICLSVRSPLQVLQLSEVSSNILHGYYFKTYVECILDSNCCKLHGVSLQAFHRQRFAGDESGSVQENIAR